MSGVNGIAHQNLCSLYVQIPFSDGVVSLSPIFCDFIGGLYFYYFFSLQACRVLGSFPFGYDGT